MLSYVPAGGDEVFFSASHRPNDPSDWFYGGLPFCWPWFGRRGPEGAGVHGCVRTMTFAVRSRRRTKTSDTVVLGCTGDGTTSFFPYPFDVELTVALADTLTVTALLRNTGTRTFAQTYGFHPFFRVGDVSKIRVGGCGAGLDFAHGNDGARDPGGRRYRIADPVLGREIAIASAGNAQIVVWNGRRGDPPKANVTSDEWKDFVCIEPVVLGSSEAVALSPGESRSLSLSVAVGKLSKEAGGHSTDEGEAILREDLLELRRTGVNLLFNANCYGAKCVSKDLEREVLEAYTSGCFTGNLLDLTEPSHGPRFENQILDNTRFPSDWWERRSRCDRGCEACGRCRRLFGNLLIQSSKEDRI